MRGGRGETWRDDGEMTARWWRDKGTPPCSFVGCAPATAGNPPTPPAIHVHCARRLRAVRVARAVRAALAAVLPCRLAGHTLRLLTFPEFLDRFIERLLLLRERFNGIQGAAAGASAVLGKMFGTEAAAQGGVGVATSDADQEEPRAVAALVKFQTQMRDLQARCLRHSIRCPFFASLRPLSAIGQSP